MTLGLKLNGIHQLLVNADNANILGKNMNIIKKNTKGLLGASKAVGLEVNAGRLYRCIWLHIKPLGMWRG
jgi:hypothetical protein